MESAVKKGMTHAPLRPCKPDQLRAVNFERNYIKHAEGSCLVRFGDTHVLCMASLDERVPPWMNGFGKGWVWLLS